MLRRAGQHRRQLPDHVADSQQRRGRHRYSPPTTLNNDQYYWRVRPVDAAGNNLDWSQVAVWQFRRNWPDQPSLQYPGNDATVGDPFYYQWTPVHHASTYIVQLSTLADFSDPSRIESCETADTTLTPAQDYSGHEPTLPCMPGALGTYYWRVQAVDGPRTPDRCRDATSSPHRCAASPTHPHMVTQTSPADGASVSVPTMTLGPGGGRGAVQGDLRRHGRRISDQRHDRRALVHAPDRAHRRPHLPLAGADRLR